MCIRHLPRSRRNGRSQSLRGGRNWASRTFWPQSHRQEDSAGLQGDTPRVTSTARVPKGESMNTTLVVVLVVVALCILLIRYALGDFRKCTKCGSRHTSHHEEQTADTSLGGRVMHPYEYRQCHNHKCKHRQVFQGITVKVKPC